MDRPFLTIKLVETDRLGFLPLLLTGDESESMIMRYLDRGDLFVGYIGDEAVSVCVVTDEGHGITEVKNLAVAASFRRQGIGREMLRYVESLNAGRTVILGTGETPSTLRFYRSCGYVSSHRIPRFFTENYPDPIIEEGVLLQDMVYLKKTL